MTVIYKDLIVSESGCIARDWAVDYHTEYNGVNSIDPYTFFCNKLGVMHNLDAKTLGQIKSRYFLYLGMIQLGLGNQAYRAIQSDLLKRIENKQEDNQRYSQASFIAEGRTGFFWFNASTVVLQLPYAKVTLNTVLELNKRYNELTGATNATLIYDYESDGCCYFQIAECNAFACA